MQKYRFHLKNQDFIRCRDCHNYNTFKKLSKLLVGTHQEENIHIYVNTCKHVYIYTYIYVNIYIVLYTYIHIHRPLEEGATRLRRGCHSQSIKQRPFLVSLSSYQSLVTLTVILSGSCQLTVGRKSHKTPSTWSGSLDPGSYQNSAPARARMQSSSLCRSRANLGYSPFPGYPLGPKNEIQNHPKQLNWYLKQAQQAKQSSQTASTANLNSSKIRSNLRFCLFRISENYIPGLKVHRNLLKSEIIDNWSYTW